MKNLVRSFLVSFLFACVLVSGFSAQSAKRQIAVWKTFAPAGANFKILLPRDPVESGAPSFSERVKYREFELVTATSEYSIQIADFPSDEVTSGNTWELIKEGMTDAFKADKAASVLGDKKIFFNNYPGREILLENGANLVKIRAYLVKNRLYAIAVRTPLMHNAPAALAKIYQTESDTFFNSFQVTTANQLTNGATETATASQNSAPPIKSQTAQRQLGNWQKFSPKGQNFKVSLPGEPRLLDDFETQTIVQILVKELSKNGVEPQFTNRFSIYELKTRDAEFGIIVLDYKWQNLEYDRETSTLTVSSNQLSGDYMLNEWMRFDDARLKANGVFFAEKTVERNAKQTRIQAFVTKNKVCILLMNTPVVRNAPRELAAIYQAEAEQFFNSFQIADNKPQVANNANGNKK